MTGAASRGPAGGGAGAPSPRGLLALALGLGLAALALYARTAAFALVHFDDDTYLADNAVVRGGLSWTSAAWAFTTFHFSNWHPLTWLSWLLEVRLFGFDPGVFHLGNAVLHAASAALLAVVLARLTGAPAPSLLAAALFAFHPLQVEAVAWASERKEVLAAFFGLLALLAYARHAERPSVARLGAVALAFAASLASKPSWVTLPCLLLVLDLWPLRRWAGLPPAALAGELERPRRTGARLLLEKVPLLLLSAASSVVTVVAQARGGALNGLELGLGARAGNALVACVRYLGKVLWPAGLSPFYAYPADGLPAWQVAGAALLLAAVSSLAFRWRRDAPHLAAGWCWFLGTLVPVVGLVQVGGQAMADRYAYLPGIGLFVALAWGAAALARREGWRRPVQAAAAAALVACAAVTWRQLGHWADHETLFRRAIEVEPASARAHAILAQGLWRDGRREEALVEAGRAVALAPASGRERANLGEMLRALGRRAEALQAFEEAARLAPRLPSAWLGLGAARADLGRLDEAVLALREAVALAPGDATAWRGLGELEAFRGRRAEAARAFRAALDVRPGDRELLERLRRVEGAAP